MRESLEDGVVMKMGAREGESERDSFEQACKVQNH